MESKQNTNKSTRQAEQNLALILPGVIIVTVAIVYGPAIYFGFTNWDDASFIVENQYLRQFSLKNIVAIFVPGKIEHERLYVPITYLTHLLEISIWGIERR